MRLILPLPPTANSYYRRVGHKVLISRKGRAFKQRCGMLTAGQVRQPLEGPIEVTATIYMARKGCDLDNRIKPLLDGMEGWAFVDDRQVVRLDVRKALDRDEPRAVVDIVEAERG